MHDLVRLVRVFFQTGVRTIPGQRIEAEGNAMTMFGAWPNTKAEFPSRERMLEPGYTLVVYSEA
jgi:hypothetical protein